MNNQLTEDQLKEIEKEAMVLSGEHYERNLDGSNDREAIEFGYIAAASKYIQRIKDLEDGLRYMLERPNSTHLINEKAKQLLNPK